MRDVCPDRGRERERKRERKKDRQKERMRGAKVGKAVTCLSLSAIKVAPRLRRFREIWCFPTF